MADVQILRAQAGARNLNKIGWTTIAQIPASEFTAGAKYLILAPSLASYSGTADELRLRIVRGDGSYRSVVSGDSPLHYYYMDESSGNLTDNGSAAQTLTKVGTTQVYSQPSLVPSLPSGTSITFDNTSGTYYQNTSATLPNTGNGSWTAEVWARIPADDATSNLELTAWGTNTANNYSVIRIAAGRLQFTNATQGGLYLSPTGVDYRDGEVHHYVVTYDGTTLTGYIDGQPTGTTATPTGGLDITGTTLRIGGAFTSWFNGSIDEVSHYSSALSASAVLAHYDAGTGTMFTDQYESDEVLGNKVVGSGFMAVYTQPSPAVPVLFQIGTSTYSQTTELLGVDLLAIKLDDIGTQGTDYLYNEDTTDHSLSTTPVDGASITFTPNGTDKYLYIAQATWTPNDNSIEQTYIDLLYDGTGMRRVSEEGEDASGNEQRSRLLMWANTPTNASHTVKVQGSMELGTTSTLVSSRIIAFNLSKFSQAHVAVGSDYRLTAFDTWENALTTSFTPDATQDYVVIAHGAGDFGSNQNPDTSWRLQVNKDGNGLASIPGIQVLYDTFTGSTVALPSHTAEAGTWVERWDQTAQINWYIDGSGYARHLGDVDNVGESQTNLTLQVADGYVEGQFINYGDGGGYVFRSNGASTRATESHYHLVPTSTGATLYRMASNSITQVATTTSGSGNWYRVYFSGHNPTIIKVIRATTQAGLDDAEFLSQTSTIGIIETTDSTAANQRASGEVGLWGFYDDFGDGSGNAHDFFRVVKYPFVGNAPDGGAWDAADESTYTFVEILPFTSGASRTINLDFRMAETAAGTKDAILAPMVVVFSKALASGTTTYSGNFTADAYIQKTTSNTFTADAYIQKTTSGTFTADAEISKTTSGTFTADATISSTVSGSFTIDAHIKTTVLGVQYESKVLADGPVAYWPLQETSGTVATDAAGWKDGSYTGSGLLLGEAGPWAGAKSVYFPSGDTTYVNFSGAPTGLPGGSASRSIELWFKTTATNQTALFGYGQNSNNSQFVVLLNYSSADLSTSHYFNDGGVNVGNEEVDGNWHHLVVTYDGTYDKFWLDGTYRGQRNVGTLSTALNNGPDIGRLFYANGYSFNGNMAHVAVYNYVLSQAQIEAHATGGGGFTADAYIKNTLSGTFTADAAIQNTFSGTFTADAEIGSASVTYPGSFTADALIDPANWSVWSATWSMDALAGGVGTFTADAYIQNTIGGTFTANAEILRTFQGSLTADAYVLATAAQTFTADAFIQKTTAGTFTADANVLVVSSGAFTADAHIASTVAGAFTADANIANTIGGTFTADANIVNTVSGTFTANAHIAATVASTFTADANISKTIESAFTADAFITKTFGSTFTADAHISKTTAGTFTADAFITTTTQGAFTADAHVLRTFESSFTADAYITKTLAGAFTADAAIARTTNGSFTADALIDPAQWSVWSETWSMSVTEGAITYPGTFTADAYIRRTFAGTFSADAYILRTFAGTFTANAEIRQTFEGSFTADAYVTRTFGQTFTADAHVAATIASTFTADAYLQKTTAGAFTADANIANTVAGSFTADAEIGVTGTVNGSFTADANIAATVSGSFTADADIQQTYGGTFTADADILVVQSGNFTADAYVRSTIAGAFSADAYIQKTVAGSFTADAEIEAATVTYGGSFTADAYIAATIASSFTADAWIAVEGTVVGQFTADAYIRNTLSGSFTADAAIRQTFGGTFTADAQVKATRLGSFTVDAHIESTLAAQFTADAYVRQTFVSTFSADAYVQQTFEGSFTADSHLSAIVAGSFTAQAYISNPNAVKRINSSTSLTGTFGARYAKTATFGSATEKAVIGTRLQVDATIDSTTGTGGTISSRTEK